MKTTTVTARQGSQPLAAIPQRSARIACIMAGTALVIVFLLHILKGSLSPGAHMLSEYALPPYGWIMQLTFLCWALGCYTLAYTLRSQVTNRAGRIGITLLYITGTALFIGGIFVIDDPYVPTPQPTGHGMLHGISAMVGLPGQAIASLLISYSLRKHPTWKPFSRPIILFANLTWISLIALLASTFLMMGSGGQFNGSTGISWFNRLALIMYCGWIMVTAYQANAIIRTAPSFHHQ